MAADGSVHYQITGDGSSLSGAANGGIAALGGISGAAALATAALATITAAATGAGLALREAMKVETTTTGINTLLKNAQLTKAIMADLQDLAANTPFELGDLAGAARSLLGGGSAVKLLREELTVLGDIASGAQTDLSGLVLVFNQVRAAGKLMGGDMMQLNQRGIGGLREELAKIKGISVAELSQAIEKGTVSADDLYRAFKNLTAQGGLFFKAMENQSKTLEGMLSTLTDEAKQLLLAFGQPMLEPAKKAVGVLTAGLQQVTAQARVFGKALELSVADGNVAELLELAITLGIKKGLNSFNKLGGDAINAFRDMFTKAMDAAWKEITLQGKSALADSQPNLDTLNKNNIFDTSKDEEKFNAMTAKARNALAKEAADAKAAMDAARAGGGAGGDARGGARADARGDAGADATGTNGGKSKRPRKPRERTVFDLGFNEFFNKEETDMGQKSPRGLGDQDFNEFFHPRDVLEPGKRGVRRVPALEADGNAGGKKDGKNEVKDATAAQKLDAILAELKRIRVV